MKTNYFNYPNIQPPDTDWPPDSWLKRVKRWAIQTGDRLLNGFGAGHDIYISQSLDLDGQEVVYVRDGRTGNYHFFYSEAELRTWLEQRHYLL